MPTLSDAERVALLESRLGLCPGQLKPAIALEALRHGSFVHERTLATEGLHSNERLEFLGDAVLGLVVSARCHQTYPAAPEGDLTRIRASLVKAESLGKFARQLGLGELLFLGRGEERSGGREKQSLLADAFEAVLAAVYLSCGLETVRDVLEPLLGPDFAAAARGVLARDYKTELQERLQGAHRAAPQYALIDAPGPQHARTFHVEVQFQGRCLGAGTGKTKKEAEQAAARAALEDPNAG